MSNETGVQALAQKYVAECVRGRRDDPQEDAEDAFIEGFAAGMARMREMAINVALTDANTIYESERSLGSDGLCAASDASERIYEAIRALPAAPGAEGEKL